MKRLTKATVRTALNLLFFTMIGTAMLAFIFNVPLSELHKAKMPPNLS